MKVRCVLLEALVDLYLQNSEITNLVEELKKGEDRQLIAGLSGGAKPVFFESLKKSIERPILIISPNLLQAQRTYEDLVKMLVLLLFAFTQLKNSLQLISQYQVMSYEHNGLKR